MVLDQPDVCNECWYARGEKIMHGALVQGRSESGWFLNLYFVGSTLWNHST